jgi:hypothetical protein
MYALLNYSITFFSKNHQVLLEGLDGYCCSFSALLFLFIAPLGEELASATTPLISRELLTAFDFATAGDY